MYLRLLEEKVDSIFAISGKKRLSSVSIDTFVIVSIYNICIYVCMCVRACAHRDIR